MRAMQEGKVMPSKEQARRPAPQTSAEPTEKVVWQSERKGVDKCIVYTSKLGEA